MPFNWNNDFFNKIRNFGKQIDQLENSVLDERSKLKEVFERNLVLEKEIAERTEELNQANKGLLTLKHIWNNMNSSEPISGVLSSIVNGLSDGLGYLYCLILQIYDTEDGPRLKIRAVSQNGFTSKIQDILPESQESYSIPMNNDNNILIQAIKSNNIKNTRGIKQIFQGAEPDINPDDLEKLANLFGNRAISVLPIIVQDKPFGCLVAISVRNEVFPTENNFLTLFAGQVELAITITELFEQIRDQAITDGLTGLFNRRYFDQCLASEVDRSLRLKQPFSLISLDLDYLKKINDTLGHSAGDAAICHIGNVLKQNARSIDIPARFGGEEFSILLPGIDVEGGMIAAERLRQAIESQEVPGVGTVTASIGMATFLRHSDSLGELLEMVDHAMYKAKRNGRNQVQMASREKETDWKQIALDTFIDVLTKQNIPINPDVTAELTQKLKKVLSQKEGLKDFLYYIVDSLAKTYDPMNQKGSASRKVEIVVKMAERAGLSEDDISKIKIATLMYDLGKVMVPESILLKPGPLSDEEKDKIIEHPIIAAREILKPLKSAAPILSMVEHHHENWDGTGYPNNLAGDDIPIGSRIISIVDTYFALVNDRPYRKALSHKEAINILKEGANTKWDGDLVEIFVEIIQKEKKTV